MRELFKDINIVYEKSSSNDIREIYSTLGIEAARKALILELDNVIHIETYNICWVILARL